MTDTLPTDRSVRDLRARLASWRIEGETVALVPTMGALHEGHLALVRHAATLADRVVVSIFVNPRQFAPHEDFDRYPRTEDADIALLAPLGVTSIYAPTGKAMYPDGFATGINVAGPAEGLETDFRPHFFSGVATVVAKLLLQALPDVAIFGEKDFQQFRVIERMVRDLDIPVEVTAAPTVRETDGLALSSRNRYLSDEERGRAPLIHRALNEAAEAIRAGESPDAAAATAESRLREAGFEVDYVAARHASTLAPAASTEEGPVRLLAAARLGQTRLIDNIGVD